MNVVALDTALFKEMYPEFAGLSENALQGYWEIDCQLIDNSEASRIPVQVRKPILYAALCHICRLMTGDIGSVGRVSSASQGSVSASLEYPEVSKQAAYWVQTQCGALVWQLLKPYRTGGLYFYGGRKY